jgi:hypothetical protein
MISVLVASATLATISLHEDCPRLKSNLVVEFGRERLEFFLRLGFLETLSDLVGDDVRLISSSTERVLLVKVSEVGCSS